jgi:cytochrome c oxidase cbb3-type subunit 3
MRSLWPWLTWFVFGFALAGCEREKRELRVPANQAETAQQLQVTSVQAGGTSPPAKAPAGYDENAYALSQGQQLYTDFNCVGCHASGGGDIGPALLDDKWIYGSAPPQIYASIVEGRPNGMPAFGPRIQRNQVWEIVAYVRSLSGLASATAAPGREDHMKTAPPPNTVERQKPASVAEDLPR